MKKIFPIHRKNDLLTQETLEETLVYDLKTNKALCLNKVSAIIWQNCNGTNSPAQIAWIANEKLNASLNETAVWFTLQELKKKNLLSGELHPPPEFQNISRRQLVKTLGASAAVALPVIFNVVAPTSAQAGSACVPLGQSCTSPQQCCTTPQCSSNVCANGICQDGCVIPDALILTGFGNQEIFAKDVCVGQSLAVINHIDGSLEVGTVSKVKESWSQGIYSLTTENGKTVECSVGHIFVSDFGCSGRCVSEYRVGESIMVYDNEASQTIISKVSAIEFFDVRETVLTFKIDTPNSTYVSGGIISNG